MGVEPEDGELGAVGQSKLVQYHADAIADRAFAQEQSGGDVAVIEALGDQRGDLTLTLAKQALDGIGGISGIVGIGRIRSPFGELAEHFRAEHFRAEHHLTCHHRLQRRPDRRHILFDEIALGAKPHRLRDIRLVRKRGQEQYARGRVRGQNIARGIQTAGAGHLNIDQQHVRSARRRLEITAHGGIAVICRP